MLVDDDDDDDDAAAAVAAAAAAAAVITITNLFFFGKNSFIKSFRGAPRSRSNIFDLQVWRVEKTGWMFFELTALSSKVAFVLDVLN